MSTSLREDGHGLIVTGELLDETLVPQSPHNPRWYLIQSKPRQDARAAEHLDRQHFECYRPVRRVERRRNGRAHLASEPLFPNYLFIRLDRLHDNWHSIRSTRGVHQIVRFGDYPVPVRDALIEGIRARLAASGQEPYLKPGESVRITEGAFSEVEAIFVASDGNERVILLMNILQTDQRVSIPLGMVRKVR